MRIVDVIHQQRVREFEDNQQWFAQHLPHLLKAHRNRFVAIGSEQVIDADADLPRLLRRLRAARHDPQQLLIEYVTDEPLELIL